MAHQGRHAGHAVRVRRGELDGPARNGQLTVGDAQAYWTRAPGRRPGQPAYPSASDGHVDGAFRGTYPEGSRSFRLSCGRENRGRRGTSSVELAGDRRVEGRRDSAREQEGRVPALTGLAFRDRLRRPLVDGAFMYRRPHGGDESGNASGHRERRPQKLATHFSPLVRRMPAFGRSLPAEHDVGGRRQTSSSRPSNASSNSSGAGSSHGR
jgi:hypothetical protein